MYRLRVPDELVRMIRGLHPELKRKVKASLSAISRDPWLGTTLREELEGLRSYHVSRFRIIYRIATRERTLEIVAIGPRSGIYEETLRLVTRETRR
jgi:mRNA interferase RelE/StbE